MKQKTSYWLIALLMVCSVVFGGLTGYFCAFYHVKSSQKTFEKEMQKVEKRQQQNQRGKDHSWRFPAEEFYTMCAQKKMTDLNNEYSFIKATNYAQQLITQENPLADMSSFSYYLERETLPSLSQFYVCHHPHSSHRSYRSNR